MGEKILFVDDDASILAGFRRQLRQQFEIDTAEGPQVGLEAIAADGPYAVVVSDLRMPGMDGVQFLTRVHDRSPDSVCVMLTGNADLDAAIAAVNEGNIFRFLTKPTDPEVLVKTLNDAIQQYNLITSERVLLQETLSGSIKVMVDVLSLTNPIAFSRASRAKEHIRRIAEHLNIQSIWQFELAALLSQMGCVALHPEVLEKHHSGLTLTPGEQETLNSHPSVGRKLLASIPRLQSVAEMIGLQQATFSSLTRAGGSGSSEAVNLGAQMLKVALDFDQLMSCGKPPNVAIELLASRPDVYNPRIVAALGTVRATPAKMDTRIVNVSQLTTGMIAACDIRSNGGMLLLARGQEVTGPIVARLSYWVQRGEMEERIRVLVPHQELPTDMAA